MPNLINTNYQMHFSCAFPAVRILSLRTGISATTSRWWEPCRIVLGRDLWETDKLMPHAVVGGRRRKVRGKEDLEDVVDVEPSSRNYQIPSAEGFPRNAVWRSVRVNNLCHFHVQPVQRLQPFLATGLHKIVDWRSSDCMQSGVHNQRNLHLRTTEIPRAIRLLSLQQRLI
jgi:hypothetical protein